MDKKDLDDIVREIVRAEHGHGVKARHYCWRRRLVFTVCLIGTTMYVGHLVHIEELTKGWEFLGAALIDKLIFGIAEA